MKRVMGYDPEQESLHRLQPHRGKLRSLPRTRPSSSAGRTVRVLAWYDNEWAFSVRMADVAVAMGKLG